MTELFQWILSLLKEFRFLITVLPWETVIRCRLGSYVKVWGPGWHLRIPFVDALHVMNTRLRLAVAPTQTLTTKDGQPLTVAFTIGFSVLNARSALMRYVDPEASIGALAQSLVARFVWEHALAEIRVPDLESAVAAGLKSECDEALDVEFVRLVDFVAAPTYRFLQEQWRPQTSTGERSL